MRFLACIIVAIAIIAAAFHFAKPLPDTNFNETFLPKASTVRYVAAGHDAAVAGLFWIKGLTELGESYLSGREYAYLGHVANLSTSLDSLFYTPYYFVGGVTPVDAEDTSDFAVLRRASQVYPEKWRLSLYYALRLARGPHPDKAEAARVMRRYFDSPDTTIPDHVRTIYRSFELDTMQVEMALESIINDVLQPRFKTFRQSFASKTYKLLGYTKILDERQKDSAYIDILNTIDLLSEGKIPPQYAYAHLLQLKRDEPAADSSAADTTVTDSSAADIPAADPSVTDSLAAAPVAAQ